MSMGRHDDFLRIGFLALIVSMGAFAMPVAFQGALGVMSYNQPDFQDFQVSYSATNRLGFGVDLVRDGMGIEQVYAIPRVNYLLHRWNGDDYQANIYVYGGYGLGRRQDQTQGALFVGGEADFETRRIYFSGKASSLMASGFDDSTTYQLRWGVAPYLADFDSLQSWFIIQAQYYTRPSSEQLRIGPAMRFFVKNVLWEIGVSAKGTWNFNFMIHF